MILHKEHMNNYTVVDNGLLNDARLSLKAKGLLCYLLSKPEGWDVRLSHLANQSTNRKTAISSGLKELRKYGYAKIEDIRDSMGRFVDHEVTIYEYPEMVNPG